MTGNQSEGTMSTESLEAEIKPKISEMNLHRTADQKRGMISSSANENADVNPLCHKEAIHVLDHHASVLHTSFDETNGFSLGFIGKIEFSDAKDRLNQDLVQDLSPIQKSHGVANYFLTVKEETADKLLLPFESERSDIHKDDTLLGLYVIEESLKDQSIEIPTNSSGDRGNLVSVSNPINVTEALDLISYDTIYQTQRELKSPKKNAPMSSTKERCVLGPIVTSINNTHTTCLPKKINGIMTNEPRRTTLENNMTLYTTRNEENEPVETHASPPGAKETFNSSPVHKIDSLDTSIQSNSLQNILCSASTLPNYEQTQINSVESLSEDELLKTKEEIGASSLAFIQKLRGAAFRRKMNLTRSRDSLAAKEKVHRNAIAASKAARSKLDEAENRSNLYISKDLENRAVREYFKARPTPATTGLTGSGGLYGVPKVEKKVATVPCSPLLGSRRRQRERESLSTGVEITRELVFQRIANGGMSGVPKVEKRPNTIPSSPLLGFRRDVDRNRGIINPTNSKKSELPLIFNYVKANHTRDKTLPTRLTAAPKSKTRPINSPRPPTQGDHQRNNAQDYKSRQNTMSMPFLTESITISKPHQKTQIVVENSKESNVKNLFPLNHAPSSALLLHSTIRAKKRAVFDIQRIENDRLRVEREQLVRQEKVDTLRKELYRLKNTL